MIVLEHLSGVMAELMRDDPRRVLLGEDVTDGGMLGLSRACLDDETLASRLLPTPLTPTAAVAHAAGLAIGGRRPILVLASAIGLVEGLAALREAALWRWRTGGTRAVPLLLVVPCGPGFSLGGDAAEAIDAVVARVPRLRVLCAGRPEDAGAWLRAAAEFEAGEDPTVLLLPRRVLLSSVEAPTTALPHDCTAAHRVRDGAAATVFAWGDAVEPALLAVDEAGIDAAVVDVGCLAPLPADDLVAHACATGKIVIVHAGPAGGGLGAELAALFADRAILHLDAPITRVTGADAPLRAVDEADGAPSVSAIAEAIARAATY